MSDARKGRRLALFRGANGTDINDTALMHAPTMNPGVADGVPDGFAALAKGSEVRVLFGKPGDQGSMSLVEAWYKPDFPLPQHSHDVDCLYYVTRGSLLMGARVLSSGDGIFTPAGVAYQFVAGPEGVVVLEFRTSRSFGMSITENDPSRWIELIDRAREKSDSWANVTSPPER